MVLRILMVSVMFLTVPSDPNGLDDFVPKDIIKARAIGCSVGGSDESGGDVYAESQVFVKFRKESGWDFTPVMSRRSVPDGGVLRAIEDCREWLGKVEKEIERERKERTHGE